MLCGVHASKPVHHVMRCLSSRRIAPFGVLVLSALLVTSSIPLHAQAPEHLIISLGTGSAFLGSGDQSAVMHSIAFVKPLNDRLGVRIGIDYLNSTNRSFDDVPFDGGSFRERVFWAGVLGLEYTPLRIERGALEHRLGIFSGFSAWNRDEEVGGAVYYPIYTQDHPDAVADLLHMLAPNERLYTFDYDDGPGGEQDGMYALISRAYHAREVGLLIEAQYALTFRRIMPSLRVGFRNYSGATVITSSFALGVRL